MRNPLIQRGGPPVSLNVRAARWGALAVAIGALIFAWPLATGYLEGRGAAQDLAARADRAIAAGQGADALGAGRAALLLQVQDPGFHDHSGVDVSTPGAGITTVTQSLAKRIGFDDFQPGWAKLRQTGLALGYESGMTKDQIFALWLETVEMGRIDGAWRIGFFDASERLFGRPPSALNDSEFADLVARLIAPARMSDAAARAVRSDRIRRLWAGGCAPLDHSDVWLEGCA
ncbi:transglycosylase domain-containing protein [Jannaschia donghaensis]|uniref:Monofunctional biosynthetic peptidoglycan transglycosylase n=1 Tax=Jannaschia donghaensis TaxID=420998 RepID=A0A0M6YHW0_9RHOB|nr:transglycosylase domain-containing protein [Jannaschia donghaensis]CTQ48857.1 monofunctional biosynthetic peptidoglycan transglycosylase [Jannaschia donghaensis]